jgi:hypothetical protein
MDWTVVFDESRGAAIVTTRGAFTATDHARMVADIVSREQWRPGHPVLFDHRVLDFGESGYVQMSAALENHQAHDARIGPSRSALLMKSLVDFGRGRQFELMGEGVVSAHLGVFLDERAAWRWLAGGPIEA